MKLIVNNHSNEDAGKDHAHIPIASQDRFLKRAYSSVDAAAASALDRLRREDGIVPTCKKGCSRCCRYHILMNIVEAQVLVQYLKQEWSEKQIDDLRIRTQQWHEWDNSRPGRYPSANIGQPPDLSNYDPCCPLLVNGECSAYCVRPVVCRTHFVSSAALNCRASTDPESRGGDPVTLKAVLEATTPVSKAIQDYIENTGVDFSRSLMLLPHWLAIEMGWDFAISD